MGARRVTRQKRCHPAMGAWVEESIRQEYGAGDDDSQNSLPTACAIRPSKCKGSGQVVSSFAQSCERIDEGPQSFRT